MAYSSYAIRKDKNANGEQELDRVDEIPNENGGWLGNPNEEHVPVAIFLFKGGELLPLNLQCSNKSG